MILNKTTRRIKRNTRSKKKNPIAKLLRTPLFKSKVKQSGKIYSRKKLIKKSF